MIKSPLSISMERYIKDLQDRICLGLSAVDGNDFEEDLWVREEGGGGRTRVLQDGNVFEKGGVNISSVSGVLNEAIASKLNVSSMDFFACGLSLVIHPRSPMVPTVHMNVRYFELENGDAWFGGGLDLTPYYPYPEDFTFFHETLKDACDLHGDDLYSKYKDECDQYFYIPHRNEMRGVGGIFFDYLKENLDDVFLFVKDVGDSFLKAYLPIVEKRKDLAFDESDKKFQLIRRGRYVEFNLIYDRGTIFGLKTNGRIESILMSLPSVVNFDYDWHPQVDSPHEKMIPFYQAQKWVKSS